MIQNHIFGVNLLISEFLAESLKANKNGTRFTIRFCSKNLIHFTNLDSINIAKIYSRNTAKNLTHFTNFPANMFLVGARKNICTVSFLGVQELHYRSTGKANICIFLYISVRKYLFQRRRKLLSGGWRNNPLFWPRKVF